MLEILGVAAIIGYFYVAIAAGRAEARTGAGWGTILTKALTWPVTIFNTIEKLYFTRPGL